jgi:two-component system cell cycle sensor histidine kinase/response regulator CckA
MKTPSIKSVVFPDLSFGTTTFLEKRPAPPRKNGTLHIPWIFVVDDLPGLTELYTILLQTCGFRVNGFQDRKALLAALKANHHSPDLLVTDCSGHSMPIETFISECRALHPNLRILVASGFDADDPQPSLVSNCRFLRKPFTGEEFLREVKATLMT